MAAQLMSPVAPCFQLQTCNPQWKFEKCQVNEGMNPAISEQFLAINALIESSAKQQSIKGYIFLNIKEKKPLGFHDTYL